MVYCVLSRGEKGQPRQADEGAGSKPVGSLPEPRNFFRKVVKNLLTNTTECGIIQNVNREMVNRNLKRGKKQKPILTLLGRKNGVGRQTPNNLFAATLRQSTQSKLLSVEQSQRADKCGYR